MIQSGDDSCTINLGLNGESILEKIDPNGFAPEWGHDDPSHDKIPPAAAGAHDADASAPTSSGKPATSGDAADQILLM